MNGDSHPGLGPKDRVPSLEWALDQVRARYPVAYMEGSCGSERSFWIAASPDPELIAHCWPMRHHREFWLRIKEST